MTEATTSGGHAMAVVQEDICTAAEAIGEDVHRLAGKRLLLTGARGYLAAYVADTLMWLNDCVLEKPCTLLALVRDREIAGGRLDHLLGRPDVEFIHQSVSQPVEIEGDVHFIVHAASRASPQHYLADPIDTMSANVMGTWHLLEFARSAGTESFLFLSSGEIYGDPPPEFVPTAESYPGCVDSTGERAVYTESKRFGETLCLTFWRRFGVPVKVARPFHVYGPGLGLDDGRVMADFLRCRHFDHPIEMLSLGSDRRAFCYIVDATNLFLKILLSGQDGEAYNVGNGAEMISIRELAETVAELSEPHLTVKVGGEVVPEHLRGTPGQVCPNMDKAREHLGFMPIVGLEEGMLRTLRWYRALDLDTREVGAKP